MELQSLIQTLNHKSIDFRERFDRAQRFQEGKLTEDEISQLKKDEEITKQKIREAEKTKVYVNFFNKAAMKLIKRSNLLSL